MSRTGPMKRITAVSVAFATIRGAIARSTRADLGLENASCRDRRFSRRDGTSRAVSTRDCLRRGKNDDDATEEKRDARAKRTTGCEPCVLDERRALEKGESARRRLLFYTLGSFFTRLLRRRCVVRASALTSEKEQSKLGPSLALQQVSGVFLHHQFERLARRQLLTRDRR
eukprot:31286-Pelagococcus_subviridis.AAC.19